MDLTKLAEALGLPKDTPADKLFAEAASNLLKNKQEAAESKQQLEALSSSLKDHGLKLDGSKLVKLATDKKEVPADETPREKELRERLEAMEAKDAKGRMQFAKQETERLVKEGKVPAAAAEKLTRLFSTVESAQALALSSDGSAVVKQAISVVDTLRDVLNALPAINQQKLSTLQPLDADTRSKRAALAKTVADRVQGKKSQTA